MASLEDKLPLSGSQLATLDDEAVQDLDQFVLRFGRRQDAIGARLLPAVLVTATAYRHGYTDRT